MQNNWFDDWFNTNYYHLLYQHRNDDEAQMFINNLIEVLQIETHHSIVDLACGKGRHSIYLNKKTNARVLGLDLSEQSIEYAIGKSNSNLTFAVHDMRQKFGVNLYDFVLNLFTSIGYFITLHDNQKVIQNISSALIKNGILVIDFLNVHLLEDLKKAPVLLEKTIENVKFITTKKIENQFIIKDIEVYDGAKKLAYQERVQALSLLDFTQFLSKSNLQITHLFGDYNLTEFNENTSPRLIIIAKKTGE